MARILFALTLAALTLSAADVSGKWSGQYESSPDGSPGPHYMVLKQDAEKITGTAGPNADQQFEISKGKISGDKLTFDIELTGAPTVRFELKVDGDSMAGQASMDMNGQQQKVKLVAKRLKE